MHLSKQVHNTVLLSAVLELSCAGELSLLFLYREAWHKLGDKRRKECMQEYVDRLVDINDEWQEKVFELQSELMVFFQ